MRYKIIFVITAMLFHQPVSACEQVMRKCGEGVDFMVPHWLLAGGLAAICVLVLQWWFSDPAGTNLDPDDPDLIAAKAAARESLPRFWQAFDNPAENEHEFMLKFNLTPQDGTELIWAVNIMKRDGRIFGTLANDAFCEDYSAGDEVEIDPYLIVDWSYYRGDVAQGHFVTRVMMKHMPTRTVKRGKAVLGWQ